MLLRCKFRKHKCPIAFDLIDQIDLQVELLVHRVFDRTLAIVRLVKYVFAFRRKVRIALFNRPTGRTPCGCPAFQGVNFCMG